MSVITPKARLHHELRELPLIFFLGPDYGGGGWQRFGYQRVAYHAAERNLGDFIVAIPCRYGADDPMVQFYVNKTDGAFEYQLDWERAYIEEAALTRRRGSVLCWLPEESKTEPRSDGQPYARDTRGEIGEIRGWMKYDKSVRFVLGAEKGFPGLDVMIRNFNWVIGAPFDYYTSLDDVARCAVRVAKRPRF